jgi:hypothetical protein
MSKDKKDKDDKDNKNFLGVDISQIKDIKVLVEAYFELLEFMVGKEDKEIVELHLTKDSKYIVVRFEDKEEDSEEDTEYDFEWV